MSVSSLRFLHADQIQLDEQPRIVARLQGDDRHLAQDATLDAFDQLIAAAVDQSVHFVLLTGNLFATEGPTLRALVRLKDGLAILEEEGIQVVIIPGPDELEILRNTSWLASNNLNDLSPWDRHPATIQCRHDKIVTVSQVRANDDHMRRVDPPQAVGPASAGELHPAFHLIVCSMKEDSNLLEVEDSIFGSFDYVGVSGSTSHREFHSSYGTAYAPGILQSVCDQHNLPSGCLSVEVDQSGYTKTELLRLTSIQQVTFPIEVPSHFDWENLVERMKSEMRKLRISPTERICVVRWEINAHGELRRSLNETNFVDEIIQFLDEEQGPNASCRICHIIQNQVDFDGRPDISAFSDDENDLINQFRELLKSRSTQHLENRISSAIEHLRQNVEIDDRLIHLVDETQISRQLEVIGHECLADAANQS